MTDAACTHVAAPYVDDAVPVDTDRVCVDCVAIGDDWLHLRQCMQCGHVACCDDSPNQHATKHFAASQHPIIRSAEPGEDWYWCYVDEVMFALG